MIQKYLNFVGDPFRKIFPDKAGDRAKPNKNNFVPDDSFVPEGCFNSPQDDADDESMLGSVLGDTDLPGAPEYEEENEETQVPGAATSTDESEDDDMWTTADDSTPFAPEDMWNSPGGGRRRPSFDSQSGDGNMIIYMYFFT